MSHPIRFLLINCFNDHFHWPSKCFTFGTSRKIYWNLKWNQIITNNLRKQNHFDLNIHRNSCKRRKKFFVSNNVAINNYEHLFSPPEIRSNQASKQNFIYGRCLITQTQRVKSWRWRKKNQSWSECNSKNLTVWIRKIRWSLAYWASESMKRQIKIKKIGISNHFKGFSLKRFWVNIKRGCHNRIHILFLFHFFSSLFWVM